MDRNTIAANLLRMFFSAIGVRGHHTPRHKARKAGKQHEVHPNFVTNKE